MTEDEAKTKWCPAAANRVVSWQRGEGDLFNAVYSATTDRFPTATCVASACMAWRFNVEINKPIVRASRVNDMTLHERLHGYCGLAGAPQ